MATNQIDQLPEKVQGYIVYHQPKKIRFITNPSDTIRKTAVQRNGMVIRYIYKPTEEIKLLAIKQNPRAILHIASPTDEMLKIALSHQLTLLHKLNNVKEEIIIYAIRNFVSGKEFTYLDIPQKYRTKKIIVAAIVKKPNIVAIASASEDVLIDAIKLNLRILIYVHPRTIKLYKKLYQEGINVTEFVNADYPTTTDVELNEWKIIYSI